jgi:predicted N-acetyltransferase YhbS
MKQTWSIRISEEGDENEIFELTEAVLGERVPEKVRWMRGWRWMHLDNPAGISRIWLAEDGSKIVSQYPVILEDMKIGEEIIKGAQLIDTMTHPQYRRQGICSTLGEKALNEIENKETHLVYCFPTQEVYPLHIKSGWLDVCAFQVMFKPLNLKNILRKYFIRNGLLLNIFTVGGTIIIRVLFRSKKVSDEDMSKVRKISRFDDRINGFWNTISIDYNIIRIRDKEYLNWRYVDVPNADYTIYVAEEEEEICGYIVLGCRKEDSLTWGYIYDIIVLTGRADIIQCLIAKAIEYFSAKEVDAIFSQMVPNKIYHKALLKNGFIPRFRSKGRFIAYNASKEKSDEFIKNSNNWFIQQGDLPGVY